MWRAVCRNGDVCCVARRRSVRVRTWECRERCASVCARFWRRGAARRARAAPHMRRYVIYMRTCKQFSASHIDSHGAVFSGGVWLVRTAVQYTVQLYTVLVGVGANRAPTGMRHTSHDTRAAHVTGMFVDSQHANSTGRNYTQSHARVLSVPGMIRRSPCGGTWGLGHQLLRTRGHAACLSTGCGGDGETVTTY